MTDQPETNRQKALSSSDPQDGLIFAALAIADAILNHATHTITARTKPGPRETTVQVTFTTTMDEWQELTDILEHTRKLATP